MKHLFLFVAISFFGLYTSAQLKCANTDRADIQNITFELKKSKGIVTNELASKYPIHKVNGVSYLSILVQVNSDFNASEIEEDGIIVSSKINDIVSLKYPISRLDLIYTLQGISILHVAKKITPTLKKALKDTGVDSVHQAINLSQAYTGKDVLIGITDWGFDYTHPMFYDTLLQNTRILAAWDQFKTSGPAPSGYSYGTEFSNPTDIINAESDTSNIYGYHYHASHVAGITGGSGAGTDYRGIAYEAQFLFATFLADEAAVLDAWEWMYDKSVSENKNLVVNMSWGLYNMGAMDGTSLLSQALDSYSDQGVLFVTSAGNNGNSNFHIQKTYSADTLLSQINFSSTAASVNYWGQAITAWGEPTKPFEARIKVLSNSNVELGESELFSTLTTTTYVDSFVVVNGITDTIWFNMTMDNSYPTNSRPQMRLRVKKPAGFKIVLQSSATSGTVHYWNVAELTTDVGNWGSDFVSLGTGYTAGDKEYGVGAPACSKSAISVAAYSSMNDFGFGGNLASFSSHGPLINGDYKPDIAAPGVSVTSAASSYTDASFTLTTSVDFNGITYPFTSISGTSMSSPVVAGISALIWEANPYLSPWQIKEIIRLTAREDVKTGDLPYEGDLLWGHGKIDAYRAVLKALYTTGVKEINKELTWTIFPNPAQHTIQINGVEADNLEVQIINMQGKVCSTLQNSITCDISNLPAGTYILKLISNNRVEQQKFVIY